MLQLDPGAPTKRLLTTADLSQFLGVSERTIAGWRLRGGGPRYLLLSGRCVRYRPSDVDLWLEERLLSSTSDPGKNGHLNGGGR